MYTENDFESVITEAIENASEEGSCEPVRRISSYEEAGVMTRNAGVVVRMEDGSEFQVTIVQSRGAGEGGW